MKKVLVGFQGHILQIEEPGNDFDIYNGPDATFQWVDGPDNVTLDWTLEYSPSQDAAIWVERDEPPTDPNIARKVAYGEVGEQLDMLYHELQDTGSISSTGAWASHISTVKSTLPAAEATPEPLDEEERMALDAIREPSADEQQKLNTEDDPIWRYCSTWWGYSGGDE
jgi:hypothetical protein